MANIGRGTEKQGHGRAFRPFLADEIRAIRLAERFERETGGHFSKARIFSRALDALERELGLDVSRPGNDTRSKKKLAG